jgi:hypothetical protein
MHVVQEGRRAGEALMTHELLVVEAPVGLSEDDVPFARYRTEGMIDRHF